MGFPLILPFVDSYEKDMVPFDIRRVIKDVEMYVIGAQITTSTWLPKPLTKMGFILCIYHITFTMPPIPVYRK